MKESILIPNPKEIEKDRIEEIKFYMFVERTRRLCRGAGMDEFALVNPLIEIAGCSDILIREAAITLTQLAAKPQQIETAVTCKLLGMPFAYINAKIMGSSKYMSLLKEYIDNRQDNLLTPRLDPKLTEEIKKFNAVMLDKVAYLYFPLMKDIKKVVEPKVWDL